MATTRVSVQVLALTLLLSLLTPISAASPAEAAPDDVNWSRVNIPAGGESGNWTLAAGSDVKYLTMAKDGAIYAYANPSGTTYTLFKSADAGRSWSTTGEVRDTITDIAAVADDANSIYYATTAGVFKSADAGKSFVPLPPGPGGAGSGNVSISSLDVVRLNGKSMVTVGTADNDSLQFGGVYILDESKLIPGWEDSGLGAYDVSAVVFSPNYASDRQLLSVVTDEHDTFVAAKIGAGGWNQSFGKATVAGRTAKAATIAFPDDYDISPGEYTLFVGIDSGTNNGDVYKIKGKRAPDNSTATDLNMAATDNLNNIDATGLVLTGNTSAVSLLAGAAGSTRVYVSTDGGVTWSRSRKEPTGQSKTCLVKAVNSAGAGTAYAATSGLDSAFSITTDGGISWNQRGLIDTRISSNSIMDLAVSPDYQSDETLFMLTLDTVSTKQSLWRSQNGGANWVRVLSSSLTNIDTLKMVEVSPDFGKVKQTVFLAGTGNGNPAIWKSSDGGQTFTYRSAPAPIDAWTVTDDNSLFFGTYNGTNGLVYSTENSGYFYSVGVSAGSLPLKSIALSPNFNVDQTILVGNSSGWVYASSNNGTSFKPLPLDALAPPLTGSIFVAFDSGFAGNKTIYAASNTVNKGIYRFIIGSSTKWERIDATLPSGSILSQLLISGNGTLYASNSQSVNATASKGGIERSINPTYSTNSTGLTFETITTGLDDGATLSGLWLAGGQLWSIDTTNTAVMTFADSLAQKIVLTSPVDKATGTGTDKVVLKWAALSGAYRYHWQVDYDTKFLDVPAVFEGDTASGSARLPTLDTGTTYYWRVRATRPVLGPWSDVRSFTTTGLGATVIAPELYSPKAGADGVALRPLFQWSAIPGASSYELMVDPDVSFSNPVINRTGEFAMAATAGQSNINLDYQTTYYWKVRAAGAGSFSDWSAVGAFITQSPPPSPSPATQMSVPSASASSPTSQPSSTPIQPAPQIPIQPLPAQSALPGWFPYLTGAMMMAVVILLAVVVVLLVIIKRR